MKPVGVGHIIGIVEEHNFPLAVEDWMLNPVNRETEENLMKAILTLIQGVNSSETISKHFHLRFIFPICTSKITYVRVACNSESNITCGLRNAGFQL